MKEISVAQLHELHQNGADFQLIDVREPLEHDIANISYAVLIPLAEVPDRLTEIARDKQVIIHCKSGGRSGNIVRWLMGRGFDNVYSLAGGITAYAQQIDTSLTLY